jgi:flagellar basal-body rod protein FlgF
MENALLVGLSRMVALSREMDTVANNVANVNTNGFKRRSTLFQEFLSPTAKHEDSLAGDKPVSFVVDRGNAVNFSPGVTERTGNPLDVAIKGDAMFVVRTPGGERYTRNGALAVNASGQLVNSDGFAIMSDQGPVQIGNSETNLRIAGDGLITSSQGNRGRLRMVAVPNPSLLRNEGQNLFSTAQALRPAAPRDARLETGVVEKSNVMAVTEISRLMEVSRSYQNIASLMQRTDEMRRSAINRLADVNS